MSASSNCVTCGIITQLRARLAPEIFLMRDSGSVSIGPNFAKSTFGHGSRFERAAAGDAGAAALPPCRVIACLTKPCTSSCRMRPFGPVPVTCARSTPSSRANLRTDGDACAAAKRASPSASRARRSRRSAVPAAATVRRLPLARRVGGARRRLRAVRRRLLPQARAARLSTAARAAAYRGALGVERQDQRAFAHLVADLDVQLLHRRRPTATARPSSPCRTRA